MSSSIQQTRSLALPLVRRAAIRPNGDGGAVFVEFLIAFLPLFLLFLGLIQIGLLFTARLLVHHAASNAARAAAVVIGDDPKRYGGELPHQIVPDGKRFEAVRRAALLTLGPFIVNGTIQKVAVVFPSEERPGGPAQNGVISFVPLGARDVSKVRVRLEVETACRIPLVNWIACPPHLDADGLRSVVGSLFPSRLVKAEAIYPYQGANYDYSP